ncbi:MAG: MmgE/PrpD family protein [Hyphomicrobiaceae bacterium]
MSDSPPDATITLARFALDVRLDAMPAEVRREGIRSLLNILGCTLGGAHHDAVEKTWTALSPFAGREQAALFGRPERTDALTAALINTLSSSVNTFDDTHAEAIIHPSGPIMGAVLALTEMRPVSGADMLAAFIVGVEAACRLSKSVSVAPAKGSIAWSQTGIACGIGAALASARLLGLDLDQTRMAIGIAAAEASGIRALHGTHCTPMMPANAGRAGLKAAFMALAGVTSSKTTIEARYGFAECFAETPHLAYVTNGLGEHWEILGNTYNPYPCGIVIHPLIDAALEIAREATPAPGAIAKVQIVANPAAMALCFRRHPKDEFEGQVSLYQWVAAGLIRGRAGIAEGTDQAIADSAITALRDRIEVATNPAIPHDGGEMTVTLADGRDLSRSIRDCIGSRGRPMTDAELDAKFLSTAETSLPASKVTTLLAALRGIETLEDAAILARTARVD